MTDTDMRLSWRSKRGSTPDHPAWHPGDATASNRRRTAPINLQFVGEAPKW